MLPEKHDPPVFCVDIDGVCCDLVESLRLPAAEALKVWPEKLEAPTQYSLKEAWNMTEEQHEAMWQHAIMDSHVFAGADVMPDCAETLISIKEYLGMRIRIASARLSLRSIPHGNEWKYLVAQDTAAFLSVNKIPFDDICMAVPKTDIRCDLAIDDSPNEILAWEKAGVPSLLMDRSYNRDFKEPPGCQRVRRWTEVYSAARDLLQGGQGADIA